MDLNLENTIQKEIKAQGLYAKIICIIIQQRNNNEKNGIPALAGELSWVKHCPIHQKVFSLIHIQGTYLSCGFYPGSGRVQEAHDLCLSLTSLPLFLSPLLVSPSFSLPVSVSLSLFLPSSLSKINKCILR